MLVDDAEIIVTNSCLLGLIVYGVIVLIEVIKWCILVRRWCCYLLGWGHPPVLGFTEGILAFCLDG